MITINQQPGRTAMVAGKEHLFFSGFAYLGMASDKKFQQLIKKGLQKYGSVYPSSRIGNVQLHLYEELENLLSHQIGLEDTAVFSSGFLASQAAIQYAAKTAILLPAPALHPSLHTKGMQLHNKNWREWTEDILQNIHQNKIADFAVVAESVNPLLSIVQDFNWLQNVQRKLMVIIDDSHGIGLLGNNGEGIISLLPKNPFVQYIICYSLAKAFSTEGGAVSANKKTINDIRRQPQFTASTAMAPAFAHAYIHSPEVFKKKKLLLTDNEKYFQFLIKDINWLQHDARLPIYFCAEEKLYDFCLQQKILLSSFPYPSPNDKCVTRIVLNSLHTKKDLQQLNNCLQEYDRLKG